METLLSSREFNQDIKAAKRAADEGPVIITDHGKPAYVLLRHDEYCRMARKGASIIDLIGMPGGEDIEFDPPRMDRPFGQSVDFE